MHISTSGNKTDQEIFDGLLHNDRSTFEYIYDHYFPMVRKLVRELGGQENDARDVFQDGVMALWQNTKTGKFKLQDTAKLTTYLVQICKWRWIEKTKKASSVKERSTSELIDMEEAPKAMADMIKEEEQADFNRHFGKLGQRCQRLLKQFYYNNDSMAKIAETFGITVATAKNEKYRCMQRLRKIFLEKANTNNK
ncbi:MAG: sigma-70 family RNA polymerase sigma factor [Bacteroidota bacterium]